MYGCKKAGIVNSRVSFTSLREKRIPRLAEASRGISLFEPEI